MRLFAAAISMETNTFSPLPSSLDSFSFLRPGEHPQDAPRSAPLWVARRRAAAESFTLIEGSCFAAQPAGVTNRRDYEFMRDEILSQLEAALPVDGVLLDLHGAMVAHGYEDVEGDILERVRALVGPKCVIGVELDPHCHLTVKRVELADIIVLYKEYPHTDVVDRAEDLLNIVLQALQGKIKPVMSLYDCRQIQIYPTTLPLMRSVVDRIKAMEGRDGVLSISIGHGFSHGDVPELSSRILVVMDGDKAKGDALATKIGEEFVSMRGKTAPPSYSVDDGIEAAVKFESAPVVIADTADNAGGGAPSDNTTILRRLIQRQIESAAVGPVWDAVAVRLCFEAGEGTQLSLRIGGKIGPASGAPIDAIVTVVGLKRDCWQSSPFGQSKLGDCAAVRIGGVEVVLNSIRNQAFGLELFRNVGIDPLARKILVVKSTNHFMAGYGAIAKKVIYVESDGLFGGDYRKYPYTRVKRPIWPLDDEATPSLIL
ncbi:microcystin LR degradation protein MlrC-like protein [Bradyrhizobium yuanmingense]|uniref:M81 family metallopeptidase n=1 Tax=Bradyrhizobium yuanmingense TaxID=108015 RepID=UPI0012F8DC48|nr:M81 family metallopeptidase [Bradyrhizobium yuanmingense]MVT55645.1 microcystin LR degradation protein MlrC-like protein [Bradyrhizobium yuanmingense]